MSTSRLSALDASFLAVETKNAHMHVGWVAVFDPPPEGPPPSFADCRDHIAAAPQPRAEVPAGARADPARARGPDVG